jgi:isopentenyl-diphosphate delta-isomerase
MEKDIGIKRAAIRRSEFELGITGLSTDDLTVGSRILYYANGCDRFAEYELDYIIFAKSNVEHKFNPDEIADTRYVSIDEFDDFIKDREITPWFRLLVDRSLKTWWRQLIDEGKFPDES